MKVSKGYKVELKLNNKQKTMLLRHAGAARYAYNWGLRKRIDLYEKEKKSTNAIEQHRELNKEKQSTLAWMYQSSKAAPQEALRDLDRAFQNFFRNIKQGRKPGFPKFKSKKNGIGSFRLTGSIHVESNRIKLPRIGWVKLKEEDRLPIVTPSQVTVREKAGHWFVSFNIQEEVQEQKISDKVIGVDLGINHLATLSDGTKYENPKPLKKKLQKLRRLSKSLSRKVKGSKNRQKAREQLARLHYKIANIRKDCLHKITTEIARTKPSVVVLEDLGVSNIMKNRKLSRSIQDAGFYEFRRQLEYKLSWIGSKIEFVDRFFPSSKTCSSCGAIKKELSLSERQYDCEVCGQCIDRDENAAINLMKAASSAVLACGDIVRPQRA